MQVISATESKTGRCRIAYTNSMLSVTPVLNRVLLRKKYKSLL